MATILAAAIAFFLWSDQGLQMDNLEQIMDHTNLLDSLLESFSIPVGIVLALVALFFYVWLDNLMTIWNTTFLTHFKFVRTFIAYDLFEILWSILLALDGSIDTGIYTALSMLPPTTSRNKLVYIPA